MATPLARLSLLELSIKVDSGAQTYASAVLYGGAAFLSALKLDAGGGALLTGGGTALNRAELKATLDGFGARKERYEFLRENRPQIADPSK